MPRPKKTDRPVEKSISIPISIASRIDLELFSELEGRVPHGKWSELVTGLLQQYIAKLDKNRTTTQGE